ncbi:MAG: hypothetical protein GKC04_00530 [Methanomicrobiales archaeon]|nr:hypothetical protein [Methanomicrobiales archaeon]
MFAYVAGGRTPGATGMALVAIVLLVTCASAAITVYPAGEKYSGDSLTVAGTTAFSPGNRILVTIEPLGFGPTSKTDPGFGGGTAGEVVVEKGNGINRWEFTVDTTGYTAGTYLVTAEILETDVAETATFVLNPPLPPKTAAVPTTAAPAETGTPAATLPPAEPSVPATPAPLPVWIAGGAILLAAILFGSLRRP